MGGRLVLHKFGFLILFIFSFVLFFNFPISNVAYAASCASNATGNWNAAGTWTSCGGTVPQAGDTVTIGAHTVTIPSGHTINQVGNVTIQNGGTLTQANTLTQTITGTLTIQSGGTLKHADNSTTQASEVDFVAAGLDVQSGGTINIDALGFDGGYYETDPPGAGGTGYGTGGGGAVYAKGGGGGGYGGAGGVGTDGGAAGPVNGSETAPASLGSGGGGAFFAQGGSGGGLAIITITGGGTATVAGTITADGGGGSNNGGNHMAGGGSGGAVLIDFTSGGTFAGGGSIGVDGGNSLTSSGGGIKDGGSGGGGRIAITGYTAKTFSGTTSSVAGDVVDYQTGPACCEAAASHGSTGTLVLSLTSTNVEPASLIQSTSNTATVTFTTQQAVPSDGKIQVIFPAGFNVSGASGATCSSMGGSFATAVASQTVTITRSGGSSEAAASESCTIGSVVNSASIGSTGTYTIKTTNSSGIVLDIDDAVTADTIISANAAPTATAPSSISQATDGTGNVTFSTTIADADANSSTVKVEISDNAGVSWYDAQITSVAGAVGSPTVDNAQAYQLRSVTTTSSNALTVVWASQHASNGNGGIDGTDQSDIQVRVTPNDATVDGSVQTSSSFSVDNLDPSGLGSFAVSSETTTTSTFSWAVATEANFNHYEIWYGTSQSAVQNRSGATEWDNSDDATLATRTTASTTITGLSVNTQYYYKIWAVDNFGNEMTVADITAYTSANTPSTPTVTAASTTSLTVVVAQNSNPASTTYAIKVGSQYVQVGGSLGVSEVWQTYATWGGASGVAATGLSANTQYAVSVKARNGDNDETSLSSSSSKYTLAGAVTSVTLSNATSKTAYGLSLVWTNNGQMGVKIDLSSVGGGACDSTYDVGDYDTAAANPSSPRSISAAASTCYKARILSYNGDGVLNSTDSAVSNELTTPAAQVTGLAYSTSDINFITWAWTAVSGATNYKVYRASDDSLIGETGSSTASYTQTTVTSGGAAVSANAQYTVYARAVDSNGEGIASSSAAAYTTANLPTTLSHDSASQTTDSMKWTWASGGSQQDFYAYMTSPTANSGFITDLFWLVSGTLSANTQYSFFIKSRNAENTQTSAVSASAYTSQSAPTGITFSSVATDSITLTADGTFTNLTTGSAGIRFRNTTTSADNTLQVTNWTNSSLSPNTQYSYTVSAKNGDGDETSTVTGSKYTLASAVTSLTVANATTTTTLALQLTWTNNGQTGMKIEQDSGCDGTYDSTAIYDNATTNATSPYTVSTGLSANTCYVYKISSYNGNGAINSTSFSTSAQITTPPAPPDTFVTGGVTATAFEISWRAVTGATNYTIYESVSGTSLGSTASTTYVFRDKTPGTAYSYYLRASNANGFSIISSVIALTTIVSGSGSGGSGGGGGGSSGSGGGGDTYVEIVRKEEERKVEEARVKTEEEKAAEDDERDAEEARSAEEERDAEGGGTATDVEADAERTTEQPFQGNGGTSGGGSGGGGSGSDAGPDIIVEDGARFRVEKAFENKQKKEKVASEQEQAVLDELALLKRASVSFSDTVASINEDNPIPREFIDFAVRKTQVFGSVLNDQKRRSEKVLSEQAKKIERILRMNFNDLSEEEKREIVLIVENQLRDELRKALKIGVTEDESKRITVVIYLGKDEFVEVRTEEDIQAVTLLSVNKLLTQGTDLGRDGVDDRIQLSLDLPLLNDDSDDDGIGVAEELSFGLDLYGNDYVYIVPKIFVHSKYGLSKVKTGKFPTIKLFGGKKGSKVKISLVSKKDNNKQLYVGEVELDDESKGVITAREVVPDDYYIIALSEDGISELAEIEVIDDDLEPGAVAPRISFSRDEFLNRALAGFPEFIKALIEKILQAMANEVKPRLIKGRAAPGSMVFVTWKSLTLSSVVMADASQGEFKVEVPPELEEGDHEAIVYVFDPQKSLLSNVSSLFFKWY